MTCCNPQTASACLGNQICCPDGTCTPFGTDCTPPGQTCGDGQFMCGDRCGSFNFGDSCCPTSNGQTHLLCGLNTQCCGDGCCPDDWICTSAGGCVPVPSTVSQVGHFVSNSCIIDSVINRVLGNQFIDPGMTVEECVQHAGSHKYAAVEYGDECYFGDSLTVFRTVDPSSCFMTCAGNASEICGGENAMNLYVNTVFVPSPTTSTITSATSFPTPLPTLDRAEILSLVLEAQDIVNFINDLLHQWQTAIQNDAGGSRKTRGIFLWLKRRLLTGTQVQEEIREQAPPKSQQKLFTTYF